MRPQGRVLSGEASTKKVSYKMFPKGCNRWVRSYLDRTGVQEGWGKLENLIVNQIFIS